MNASDDGNGNHPSETNEQRRKGKGRQKIAMEKIENETNLQVTFSKRRAGVFKKASELSTLCGAESAVVVFSPGNKPHSFGHPNVETVANRFLHASGEAAPPQTNADQLIMAHSEAAMQQRNHELVGIEAQLELERQRKKDLDGAENQRPPPLEEMDYEQLDQMKKAVLSFKHELEAKVKSASAAMEAMGNNPAWDALPYEAFGNPNMTIGNPNLANIPVNPGGAPFPPPFDPRLGNYGYTVQYPPFGVGGSSSDHVYNYGDPSGVVQYEAGSSEAGTSSQGAAREDERNKFQNFGGNYRRA